MLPDEIFGLPKVFFPDIQYRFWRITEFQIQTFEYVQITIDRILQGFKKFTTDQLFFITTAFIDCPYRDSRRPEQKIEDPRAQYPMQVDDRIEASA